MPINRLAPNDYNALYNRVPDPTARTPEYAPPLGIRQQLENVSAGLGRGAVTQLQDVQALVSDPRAYATNTLRGMRELMRNPALIGNVLRDTARRAKSGPLGFGEVAGEMLPLRLGGKVPSIRGITRFKTVNPGEIVDDLIVRKEVPNMSSIGASLDEYEILPGIRSVPISDFGEPGPSTGNLNALDKRTRTLAEQIAASKEINPLIVVYSGSGNYILEGSHRIDALDALNKQNIPVMVVIDKSDPPSFMKK